MKIKFEQFKKILLESENLYSLNDELAKYVVKTNHTIFNLLKNSNIQKNFNNEKYRQYFDIIGYRLCNACRNNETLLNGMIKTFKNYIETLNNDHVNAFEKYISIDDYGRFGYRIYPINSKVKEFFDNPDNLSEFYSKVNNYSERFSDTEHDFKSFINKNQLIFRYDF